MIHIKRYLSAVAALAVFVAANAYTASFYQPESKLSSGHWVKISVDTTGIYQVTPEQLAQWGFDDPDAVKVYGYGSVAANNNTFSLNHADDMVETPSVRSADGRLLFYGEGPVRASLTDGVSATFARNTYTNTSAYFLCADYEGENFLEQAHKPAAEGAKALDWHYCVDLIEDEVQCPASGGNIFHGPKIEPGGSMVYPFRVRDFGASTLSVPEGIFRFEAGVNTPTRKKITMRFSDNVSAPRYLEHESGANNIATKVFVTAFGEAYFRASSMRPLKDTRITMTITVPSDFPGNYAAIDRAYLIYPRYNELCPDLSELMLNVLQRRTTDENFVINQADADVQVWNVTDPTNVIRYQLAYDETKHTATGTFEGGTSAGVRRLVAFNPSATHRSVNYLGTVANQNLHAEQFPELIIVTTASLREAAEELGAIHRKYQGYNVLVVDQEEVFNEFASGSAAPMAVRRLAKMFYDRDPERLRYICMYGAGTWDPRFLQIPAFDNLVAFECENFDQARESSMNYVSDQYFGMLADNYDPALIDSAPMQVSVGRIPARNITDARTVNRKVEAYLADPPTAAVYYRAIKISDDGDAAAHFDNSEMLDRVLIANPAMTVTRADNMLFPWEGRVAMEARRQIVHALERGQGFYFYSGHGTSTAVTGEYLMNTGLIKNYTYNHQPLSLFSSCDAFPFDRESGTLCDVMVLSDGGSIGSIGACRSVYLDHNHLLSMAIARAYANADGGDSGADVFRNARQILLDEGMQLSLGYNTLCFNYCGDPAVPLAVPTYKINILSVGGVAPGEAVVKPFENVAIEAEVVDADGNLVADFNGPVLVEFYDGAFERSTIIRSNDDRPQRTVLIDEQLLGEYPAVATAGRISANVMLPDPSHPLGAARVVVTATDNDSRLMAGGGASGLSYAAADTEPAEGSGKPSIIEFGVDADDYVSDDAVGPDFTLQAVIDPSAAGLSVATSGIRARLAVSVDGNPSAYANSALMLTYGEDGMAHLSLPVRQLSQGRHTFRLRAVSNTGESDEAVVAVTVGTPGLSGTLAMLKPGPARSEAQLDLEADTYSSAHLFIANAHGTTIYSDANAHFPYVWDLIDNDGDEVADGAYSAWVLLDSDTASGSTPKIEIVVVR